MKAKHTANEKTEEKIRYEPSLSQNALGRRLDLCV